MERQGIEKERSTERENERYQERGTEIEKEIQSQRKKYRTRERKTERKRDLPQTEQVPSTVYQVLCIRKNFGYCYRSVNIITLGLAQSDHIKRLPLYQQILKFKTIINVLPNLILKLPTLQIVVSSSLTKIVFKGDERTD